MPTDATTCEPVLPSDCACDACDACANARLLHTHFYDLAYLDPHGPDNACVREAWVDALLALLADGFPVATH